MSNDNEKVNAAVDVPLDQSQVDSTDGISPASSPTIASSSQDSLPQTSEPVDQDQVEVSQKQSLIERLDAFLDKAECAAERDAKSILAFIEKHL